MNHLTPQDRQDLALCKAQADAEKAKDRAAIAGAAILILAVPLVVLVLPSQALIVIWAAAAAFNHFTKTDI